MPVHAYVLMPDHVHLLITPTEEGIAGGLMQRLGRRYVRYFNDRHARSGTLWEGRYRSTVIEPARYLLACYRYIERNPVRAGLVSEAAHYTWSSCRHHLGLASDPLLTDHACYWALGNTPFERQAAYGAMLEAGEPPAELAAIRYAAHTGWMLGQAGQSAMREPIAALRRLPKGRPPRPDFIVAVGPRSCDLCGLRLDRIGAQPQLQFCARQTMHRMCTYGSNISVPN